METPMRKLYNSISKTIDESDGSTMQYYEGYVNALREIHFIIKDYYFELEQKYLKLNKQES